MQILRELIFHPNSKFTTLNLYKISNDHFSYHINKLLKDNLIQKEGNGYSLTKHGKIFSAKMDTTNAKDEKQPKVSVMIRAIIKKEKKLYYAIQKRMKEPYFGFYGFMTGKIKWGEKVSEAVERELMEEMHLSGKIIPAYILHEMVYDKDGNMLEDKFFHAVTVVIKKDTLEKNELGCQNQWMTKEEFLKVEPKYHNEMEIFNWFENKQKGFVEQTYFIDKF